MAAKTSLCSKNVTDDGCPVVSEKEPKENSVLFVFILRPVIASFTVAVTVVVLVIAVICKNPAVPSFICLPISFDVNPVPSFIPVVFVAVTVADAF